MTARRRTPDYSIDMARPPQAGWTPGTRKVSTESVVLLRQENPEATSAWIAREVGLTRERVRQILKRAVLPTRAPFRTHPSCQNCGKTLPYRNPHHGSSVVPGLCKACTTARKTLHFTCETCKHPFIVTYSQRTRKSGRFCTHRCAGLGLALGKRFGWGNPDHPIHHGLSPARGHRKYGPDEEVVARLNALLKQGLTTEKASKTLAIPRVTLDNIVRRHHSTGQ